MGKSSKTSNKAAKDIEQKDGAGSSSPYQATFEQAKRSGLSDQQAAQQAARAVSKQQAVTDYTITEVPYDGGWRPPSGNVQTAPAYQEAQGVRPSYSLLPTPEELYIDRVTGRTPEYVSPQAKAYAERIVGPEAVNTSRQNGGVLASIAGRVKNIINAATAERELQPSVFTTDFDFYSGTGNIGYRKPGITEADKSVIDRINASSDSGEEKKTNQLMADYQHYGAETAIRRDDYRETLPNGSGEFDAVIRAVNSGDLVTFRNAKQRMINSGYEADEINSKASEQIRKAYTGTGSRKIDAKTAERELQQYCGVSQTDAHASTALWWFTDINGKKTADTDGNGYLKLDELGNYLLDSISNGSLDEDQASAVFEQAKPTTSKKTFQEWRSGKGKTVQHKTAWKAGAR